MISESGPARVGIECSRSAFRGVRVAGGRVTCRTARTLPELLAAIGASRSDDCRLAMTGLISVVNLILTEPPFSCAAPSFRAVSKLTDRDLLWEMAPLSSSHALLVAAPCSAIESELNRIGVSADFPHDISFVGTETLALVAAARDLPGADPIIWADESGSWLIERTAAAGGTVISNLRAVSSHIPVTVRTLVGPLARARTSWAKAAEVGRAGGLEPEYFVAWGATKWGGRAFSCSPHLEPGERRAAWNRRRRENRSRRLTWAAAGALFLASIALPIPARLHLAEVQAAAREAEERVRAAEAALREAGARAEALAPPGRRLHHDLRAVLEAADAEAAAIRLDDVTAKVANSSFQGLRLARGEFSSDHTIRISGSAAEFPDAAKFQMRIRGNGARVRRYEIRSLQGAGARVSFKIEIGKETRR